MKILKWFGLAITFLWFAIGGVAHFTSTDMFMRIMPPYLPWHSAAVYLSGVFEIVGAIGICIPRFRQWAGNGLILLTVLVSPANVYMWMNPHLFPTISATLLGVRLIVQVLLIACIWWSTRTPKLHVKA
jgi:uncharacterized membrane protein